VAYREGSSCHRPSSGHVFDPQAVAPKKMRRAIREIKDSRHRPVPADPIGCGDSDKPKNKKLWTIERYARELGELREALKLERIHILGHSWGTMAVDYMLAGRTGGVQSLVLAGPCLSASRWYADQRAHLRRMPENFRRIVRRAETSENFASKPYQTEGTRCGDAQPVARKLICPVLVHTYPPAKGEKLNMETTSLKGTASDYAVNDGVG
jgi:proline-specific peptidase